MAAEEVVVGAAVVDMAVIEADEIVTAAAVVDKLSDDVEQKYLLLQQTVSHGTAHETVVYYCRYSNRVLRVSFYPGVYDVIG